TLGVRIGAFSLCLPALLEPQALAFAQALATGPWTPPVGALSKLPQPTPEPRALAARGLRAVAGLAVPVAQLEQLDEVLRAAFKPGLGMVLSDQALADLGWSETEASMILRAL